MLKKFFMALLIAAASFNFVSTSEAADAENYCCRGYNNGYCYDNGCCYYNYEDDGYRHGEHHDGEYRGGRHCR